MRPLLFLLSFAFSQVVSQAPPPPPHNIRVEKGQLTWANASERFTYTVEYRSSIYSSNQWELFPDCVNISKPFCNVTGITQTLSSRSPEDGCMMLRVRAEWQALRSEPVEACSSNGSTCTPPFSLLALPGSLTVHLSDNHKLAEEHANNAKHRIFFGKEGEELKIEEDTIASTTFKNLDEGQRYCVQVKYILYGKLIEPPSCIQCAVIPASQHWDRTPVIAGVVSTVIALAIIISAVGYLLLFQRQRIKQWLRLPYQIPPDFMDFPSSSPQISEPREEICDIVHVSPYMQR